MRNLDTYIGFDPNKIADYFSGRRWPAEFIPLSHVNLVKVTKGSALECGDGRFDYINRANLIGVNVHGTRVLGGINAVMALITGGNDVGLERATALIKTNYGLNPGTHGADEGGCGFVDLWMEGKLKSAIYAYELGSDIDKGGLRIGNWLKKRMRESGGRHFRLNGNHNEEGVRINSFKGMTEASNDGDRFRVDDWFMAGLGIPDYVRWYKIAEVIEKLKPEACKLEIIVP